MSFTTGNNGRLCNQIIRNLAVHFIAKKHNLNVNYYNYELIKKLGIELFIGEFKYDNTIKVNNNNYFSILNTEYINNNIDAMDDYFQTESITNMIHNYIKENKNIIKLKNNFRDRYNNNNDVFLHIRLTDAAHHNPGLDYYLYCLSQIQFENIYISTDNFNDNIINEIIKKYPNSKLICKNEIETIQFGSTCKHIILSHGSFSAVIGYLGFYSNIYYLNKDPKWCPIDMFTNKGWNAIDLNVLKRN